MAPKKPLQATTVPLPSPPAPMVEGDLLDEYSEGEEEEIPKSKIKIQIIAATGVWDIESGEEKSKIGFDIIFPEEPPASPPDPLSPLMEMEAFLPDIEPISKEVWPLLPTPPLPPPNPNAPPLEQIELPLEPPPPPSPANFNFNFEREYERTPSYHLCNTLVQQEMVINVYWISPTGATKAPIAIAKVNLVGLLHLDKCTLTSVYPLMAYVEPELSPAPATLAKKVPPPPSKKSSPSPQALVVPTVLVEEKPTLLKGATLKVVMTTSKPLVTEADRKYGFIMEVGVVTIRHLPSKVQQYGSLVEGSMQPFAYTIGFTLPGFTSESTWWNAVNDFDPIMKATFGQFKATTGIVIEEEVEVPKNLVMPMDKSIGHYELKRLLFGEEEVKLNPDIEKMEADEVGNPPLIKEMQKVIVWKAMGIKRYLPSQAANEVRDNIKRRKYIQGSIARYLTEESFNNFVDPFFDRYRGTFDLDMMPFLDNEGATCLQLPCPVKEFNEAIGTVFCPRDPRPPSKGQIVEDDSRPLLATSSLEPSKPLPNAWKEAKSTIYVTIKTSVPIEPLWKPPPEPELIVENLIPYRPRCPNLHDSVKFATKNFKKFIQIAAHDISNLHQKYLQEEEVPLGADATLDTKSRIQSKEDVRKKVVLELHQSGAWQQMRNEMKSRVLRIAAERFRLGQKDAITVGKFEFCNTLYINLMEEIHACLAEMFLKRQRTISALDGSVCKELNEKEKRLFLLRQLADEYEYDLDYCNANKYHQDRLLGEAIYNPDIWFEYGCFSMRSKERGQSRDHGKAEECFREALTLDNKHFLSLLALACLMWHRNYCTQSEVFLRTAIDLHTEEEWMCWCILSQVYHAQGQRDNEKSCIRKAEVLFKSSRENRNAYTSPHVLLDPLLKFPFSVGYLFIQEKYPSSTVYVETSLLLLDLYLQKEGKQILDLECDVFSTAFDNKWAQAKAHELNKEYTKAEIWIKENLSITQEDPMSWLCLGRIHYINKKYTEALEAYEKHIRYQGKNVVYPYVYFDIGNIHLKLKNYNIAKKVFLKLCQENPSTSSWLGAGIAFFRTREYKHCEIALVEANHIDSKNPKVWAYLILVCLALDRNEEAEISFQQLQKVELYDVSLLLELADGFAKCGNFRDAEAAARDALKEEDGQVVARFKLGELNHQQGKLECAKSEYENIMNLKCSSCVERSLAEERFNQMQTKIMFSNNPTSDRRVTM